MSDTTQGSNLAPSADEVGDGGASIAQQAAEQDGQEQQDVEQPTSQEKQADGDLPIMT